MNVWTHGVLKTFWIFKENLGDQGSKVHNTKMSKRERKKNASKNGVEAQYGPGSIGYMADITRYIYHSSFAS